MHSESSLKRKSNFDVLPAEMPNQNTLENLPAICAKLSSIANNIWTPATDTAFTIRLEKALQKNLDYIYMKDNNLLQSKPNSTSSSTGISTLSRSRYPIPEKVPKVNNNIGIGMKTDVEAVNTHVVSDNNRIYISGFPVEFTDEDIDILFSTQGKIKKLKFYHDENGNKKGDALLTYVKNESVLLSIAKLNGLDIGDNYKLSVTLPDFKKESDGVDQDNIGLALKDTDPDIKYLMSIFGNMNSNSPYVKDYRTEAFTSSLKSLLSIQLECEKYPVLIINNAYDIDASSSSGPNYITDIEGDLLMSCCEYGKVKSIITPTELLPSCILAVFTDTECALKCAYGLHNKWFDKRQLKILFFKPSILSLESAVIESKCDNNCSANSAQNDETVQDFDLDNFFNTLL